MSDLHLEVGQQYANFHITPRATRLILAGDIGRLADYEAFRDFLQLQCEKFALVYLVLGNHEFFGVSRQGGLRLAAMLQQEPGLSDKLIVMNWKMESGLKWKIIVISHHAPSTKGTKSSDEGNPWSSAFGTDLLGQKERSHLYDVQLWIFGHTHHSAELLRGQVKLVSNQRGYVVPNGGKNGPEISGSLPSKVLKLWGYTRRKQGAFDVQKIIEV
ncbi:hypothetical protein FQN55_005844 [Onygenales sp. PD_40]|nr:hypothetical protein FQN55_005844 [Onygenales sp. PD_40]KAK2807191.1 hypothetical protein FQN51_004805 [Onygenales sp. PD_10]